MTVVDRILITAVAAVAASIALAASALGAPSEPLEIRTYITSVVAATGITPINDPTGADCIKDQNGACMFALGGSFVGIDRRLHVGPAQPLPGSGQQSFPLTQFDGIGAGPYPTNGDCIGITDRFFCGWVHRHGPASAAVWPLQLDLSTPFFNGTDGAATARPDIYDDTFEPGNPQGSLRCRILDTGQLLIQSWRCPYALLFEGVIASGENPTYVEFSLANYQFSPFSGAQPGDLRLTIWGNDGTIVEEIVDWPAASFRSERQVWAHHPAGIAGMTLDSRPDFIDMDIRNAIIYPDTDDDGFPNPLDGDFNQSGNVDATDHSIFVQDFQTGVDSGVGTDMNGSGSVNATDHVLFLEQFLQGQPGLP